jgi:hypothetical protein
MSIVSPAVPVLALRLNLPAVAAPGIKIAPLVVHGVFHCVAEMVEDLSQW